MRHLWERMDLNHRSETNEPGQVGGVSCINRLCYSPESTYYCNVSRKPMNHRSIRANHFPSCRPKPRRIIRLFASRGILVIKMRIPLFVESVGLEPTFAVGAGFTVRWVNQFPVTIPVISGPSSLVSSCSAAASRM